MAKKRNVPVPPDRELDRLGQRFDKLQTKVNQNMFKSEMGGSRLADARLRYQLPKLEQIQRAQSNRLNEVLAQQSSADMLRKVVNSPNVRGGAPGRGMGQGGSGGGGFLKRTK